MSGVFERLQSSLGRNLFGQDIFICYSRRDAGTYAAGLAHRLAEKGYATFVDRLGTHSSDLPAGIRKALSSSSMMVVLATDGARDSKYIAYEIEEFRKNRGSSSIIVVDFDGSLSRAGWFHLVEGLAPATESVEALSTGEPSDSVVYQIDRSFTYAKSKDRLRRYRNRVLAVFVILLAIVVATAVLAMSSMRRVAQAMRQLEELNRELADKKAQVDELTKQQAGREAHLAELEYRLKLAETSVPKGRQEIEKQIDELHSQLAASEAQVKTLNGQVVEKNAQITELTSQLDKEKTLVSVLTEASKRPAPEPSPSKPPKEETPWSLVAAFTVLGIMLAYSGACAILLRTKPLWILRLYEQISLDKIIDAADSSVYAKLAKLLVAAVGIDYFAKHARTREAWVVSYRLGNSQLRKLPAAIKAEYIKHDDVLDAWAEIHREKVREALERSRILKGSQYVVPLRIKVGEDATPTVLRGWKEFGYLFENEERTLVQIVGKGGSGKTTLAGELARAAIDQNPDVRLTKKFIMIPVLISAETHDFFKVVSDSLGTIFDGDDDKLDQDFIRVLLRRKRILVIFDGLSEKSGPTAAAVGGVADVRALIVTTRYEHNLAVGDSTVLRPMGIAGDDIEDFISKYMKRPEVRKKLSEDEIDEASDGVKAVFVDRDNWNEVTPLIVTLVADHAFELWCRQKSLEGLAASTADAITAYVRRVDPREKEAPQFGANKTLIPTACALAKCCLSPTYAPGSVSWDAALAALENDRFGGESSDILRRFIQNEVLEEYEVLGKTYLKFNLDPVAEYLAAMYWINHLGGDAVAWSDWLRELETAPGYQEGIQGFLGALEDCVEKGKTEFGVPDLVFPWTKVTLPAEVAITDSINVPSSAM